MIEKRTHMQKIVNVQSELLEIAPQLRRTVDISGDDVVQSGMSAFRSVCLATRRATLLKSAPTRIRGCLSSTAPRAVWFFTTK